MDSKAIISMDETERERLGLQSFLEIVSLREGKCSVSVQYS